MDLKNTRILVVDDDEQIRKAHLLELQDLIEGVVVETATDGLDALLVLGTRKIDLIISDLSMLRMNGLELFRALKENPNFKKIPFIMLTGSADIDVERTVRTGGGRFVLKGSNYDLLEKLRR